MADPKIDSLIERMLGGDRLALARLITLVESGAPAVPEIMKSVFPRAQAHRASRASPWTE